VTRWDRQIQKRRRLEQLERVQAIAVELEIDGVHVSPPLTRECPECTAAIGRRCLTRLGKPRKDAHDARKKGIADELWQAHWLWCGCDI